MFVCVETLRGGGSRQTKRWMDSRAWSGLPQWLIRRVDNPEAPGSRPARVHGTPGGALVVWP